MRSLGAAAAALLVLALAACGGTEDVPTDDALELGLGTTGVVVTAMPETTPMPLTVPVPQRDRPIGPTSRGQDVKAVQRALRELGYKPGKADGFYGKKTRKAVLAFQREHGLDDDGVVGPKTARAINEALSAAG